MIGYILIAIVVVAVLYIVIQYSINTKKINSQKKSEKKSEVKPKNKIDATEQKPAENKVEVKSTIINGTALENAMMEAEKQTNKTTIETENQTKSMTKNSRADKSRLKLDREDFVSEIQKQKILEKKIVETESGTSNQNAENDNNSISEELKNLSPELKAILINDILNKKY